MVTAMMPDLRFVLGALIATALLSVTAFGLGAAIHIAHQSKAGPLEAMLAYTPSDARGSALAARDNPFAQMPASPGGMRSPAANPVVQTAAETTAEAAAAAPESAAAPVPPAGDHDTVDERAVVDPPLPADGEPDSAAAAADPESAPPASESIASAPVAQAPDVEQVGSLPSVAAEPAIAAPPAMSAALPKAKKAKAKPARKAIAKTKPRLRARSATLQPSASTGYAVMAAPNGFVRPTATTRNLGKGLWPSGE